MVQGETSIPDPLELLARMSPRKRRRFTAFILGPAPAAPTPSFMASLASELGREPGNPDFFGLDIELDAVYAAFTAASAFAKAAVPESNLFEDRRGRMEMDGFKLDAVLAYRGNPEEDAPIELVLVQGRNAGKWSGRRSKRIVERLRRIFGDDGRALPKVRARFLAVGGERPGRSATAAWPAWMTRADGSAAWLPFIRADGEVSIIRCDRHGRPRRIGEFWKLG